MGMADHPPHLCQSLLLLRLQLRQSARLSSLSQISDGRSGLRAPVPRSPRYRRITIPGEHSSQGWSRHGLRGILAIGISHHSRNGWRARIDSVLILASRNRLPARAFGHLTRDDKCGILRMLLIIVTDNEAAYVSVPV